MQKNITGNARRQYQHLQTDPLIDTYMQWMAIEHANQMADESREDMYRFTDHLLKQDVSPCEAEYPEEIEVTYEREPIDPTVFNASVTIICIIGGCIIGFVAWLIN